MTRVSHCQPEFCDYMAPVIRMSYHADCASSKSHPSFTYHSVQTFQNQLTCDSLFFIIDYVDSYKLDELMCPRSKKLSRQMKAGSRGAIVGAALELFAKK